MVTTVLWVEFEWHAIVHHKRLLGTGSERYVKLAHFAKRGFFLCVLYVDMIAENGIAGDKRARNGKTEIK